MAIPEYTVRPSARYGSVNDAVDAMQEGHCLFCGKTISQHHIVARSKNGSDTMASIAGLCDDHYDLVHKEKHGMIK